MAGELVAKLSKWADAVAMDADPRWMPDVEALIRQAAAHIETLLERERVLVEALKPFAKAGELFGPRPADSYNEGIYAPVAGSEYNISGDDLRRAASALEGK